LIHPQPRQKYTNRPYQSLYSWKSGHVIGTIVSGVVALTIFGLYETFAPLKEPYLPVAVLQNYKFTAAAVWAAIAAMTFYAFGYAFYGPHILARLTSST
jgi:hypothetical protein